MVRHSCRLRENQQWAHICVFCMSCIQQKLTTNALKDYSNLKRTKIAQQTHSTEAQWRDSAQLCLNWSLIAATACGNLASNTASYWPVSGTNPSHHSQTSIILIRWLPSRAKRLQTHIHLVCFKWEADTSTKQMNTTHSVPELYR